KVMALASFGRPRHAGAFREIVRSGPHGSYEVHRADLVERFGPARQRGDALEARHFDIARSLQLVLEETVLDMARWLHAETGSRNLAMAGGVALNCVMNARVRDLGPFENIWVQPAAGDAGTSLGAALWVDAEHRQPAARAWTMDHAFYGPAFDDDEIEAFLKRSKLRYR